MVVWEGEMESVLRVLLIGLLMVSASSAVQFCMQRSVERGRGVEPAMERAGELASRAIERSTLHLARAGRELGAVASRMRTQVACGEAARTMEDIWKAYGH